MRTKSKEEQYLSDFLSKLGQGAGESGTIEVDALAALGTIEHRIDEMLVALKSLVADVDAMSFEAHKLNNQAHRLLKAHCAAYYAAKEAIARAEGKGAA